MRTDIVKEAFDGHHNGRVKNNFQSQCLSDIVVEKKALVGIIIEKEDSIAKLEKVVEKLGMFLAQKRQQKVDDMCTIFQKSNLEKLNYDIVADLETDVARLQHDLISKMAATEEARADASELRKNLREKKGEVRIRDLERKIGVLETKEIEEKNKKIRFEEEEMRQSVRIEEGDADIGDTLMAPYVTPDESSIVPDECCRD
ncbi:uncharacterized protein HKW66_Vig0184920 [Vigna angularis]|uniref:Uncharacterized protein n=1 Tax=Phaseolus angularis TaxID=3914 RepID=A0A8T0KU00_PHAAN|nr:uncharacterized protein HKW66_Vig0184920 [Vigna angularis]